MNFCSPTLDHRNRMSSSQAASKKSALSLFSFVNFLFEFFQFIAKALQFEVALSDLLVQLASLSFQRLEMITDQKASHHTETSANHGTGTHVSRDAANAR